MAQILIADIPESFDCLRQALALNHTLSFASTLGDAENLINSSEFDLCFIGLQFAESQAFELMQLIRTRKGLDKLPVVMYSGRRNRVTDFVIATAGRCAKLLGAQDFLDFSRCKNDWEIQTLVQLSVEKCLAELSLIQPSTFNYRNYERGTTNARQRNPRQA